MMIEPSSKQKEIIKQNISMAKNINKFDCDYNTYPEFVKVACGNWISGGYSVTAENVVKVSNTKLKVVEQTKKSIEMATITVIAENKF